MMSERRTLAGCTLLAIFAHPDDESIACGGVLAWCARLGARVAVCCATGGELGATAGMRSSPPPTPAEVRKRRQGELRRAARVLGVAELVHLDYADGMLPWTDEGRIEADLRDIVQRLRPDVVITFGEDGLYGHPDHIAIHERATAAVSALGARAPALYYVTSPPGSMRAVMRHAATCRDRDGRPAAPLKILGIQDADAFGALAPDPTLVVHVGRLAAAKLAAIHCHRTQLAGDALMTVSARDAERLLGIEHFHRAAAGRPGGTFLEQLGSSPPR